MGNWNIIREEIKLVLLKKKGSILARKESTISLAGQCYRVPPGYINCRIWVKILGNKIYFEAMNKIFWKQRLKT